MYMPNYFSVPVGIQSTAGAVAVRNEKGQVSMEKVKVVRYVSGKRPEYAPNSSSEDESGDELLLGSGHERFQHVAVVDDEEGECERRKDIEEDEQSDPRLRRLMSAAGESTSRSKSQRVGKPEVINEKEDASDYRARRHESESESEEEVELDDSELEKRRAVLRQRAWEKRAEEAELLGKEDDEKVAKKREESESEYEEYTTDSEEEARPRLKPVFVSKGNRVTVKDKDGDEENSGNWLEEVARVMREKRRKETLKILEEDISKERRAKRQSGDEDDGESQGATVAKLTDVNTDDENEEAEYEAWKIRELKRLKKDREEREEYRREQAEIARLHKMTEAERWAEMRRKPKVVLNKATKGKYRFLQKYYHRGAFFLDKEEEVLKRDVSRPTLEDRFDKTILPKVMQVKNFGRSGRTKYTHLVDQDTTQVESAWAEKTPQNIKFQNTRAAGVRQIFQKPTLKRDK